MPGPCTPWITGDDVMDCCSVETTDGTIFDLAAEKASDVLFELSGRLFAGECGPKKVRPYCHGCSCGHQILARGHIVAPYGSYCDFCLVSCSPSLVKLPGVPVRAISEVKINGSVLAVGEYRLHQKRYAMRLNSTRWPIRQNLTIADTNDNTFSITYTYGEDPPEVGIEAATELACELYKACANVGECQLPTGVARLVRQGITIERSFLQRDRQTGAWRTGLRLVDAFLNAYNPRGIMRRPVFWSPSGPQYAQEWE